MRGRRSFGSVRHRSRQGEGGGPSFDVVFVFVVAALLLCDDNRTLSGAKKKMAVMNERWEVTDVIRIYFNTSTHLIIMTKSACPSSRHHYFFLH